jgi:hypothetical protein
MYFAYASPFISSSVNFSKTHTMLFSCGTGVLKSALRRLYRDYRICGICDISNMGSELVIAVY